MKVSELEGAALDYWVARAMGYNELYLIPDEVIGIIYDDDECGTDRADWEPSTNWAQGGPLLDEWAVMFEWAESAVLGEVFAYMTPEVGRKVGCYAPDRLIGGMRAIVMHVYGDTVDDLETTR